MDIVKYNFNLSAGNPFIYDFQYYDEFFSSPGYDIHEAIHLLIMLKGVFALELGGANLQIMPGDAVLTAPWELHGNYSMSSGAELLSVTCREQSLRIGLSSAAKYLDHLLLQPPAERMKILHNSQCGALCYDYACEVIKDHRPADNCADDLTDAGNWLDIQMLFLRIFRQAAIPPPPPEKMIMVNRLRPALELLNSGRIKPLSTADAAGVCHLSSGYFNKIFQMIYGLSFYAFELRYRLHLAAEEAAMGCFTVKELAARWGFADASHFSRTFKKYYNCAPSEYRQ